MRQYQVFYRRLGVKDFAKLQPNVHSNLYNRPEIKGAVEYIRTHLHVEGVSVRLGTEQFNIIASDQDELTANAFQF
jgi:hypothetical protein